MKKLIKHIKTWNRWRKSYHSKLDKVLVLFGLKKPLTFLVTKTLFENRIPEIKPLSWNHNHEDKPLMRNCKVTVDELHNIKVEGEMTIAEATDDTVYVRTELTKDDIIESTDFDFKEWLEEEEEDENLTTDDIIMDLGFDFTEWLEETTDV